MTASETAECVRGAYVQAASRAAGLELALGQEDEAVELARSAPPADRFYGRSHRALIRALDAGGRDAEATQARDALDAARAELS